jgi:uncharacterized membrane protein YgdD (TMEM256/DUF423 family)
VSGWLAIAAVNGALAVLAGAFAAHGLSARLDLHSLAIFETGARYHMYTALALGIGAVATREQPSFCARLSAWMFLAGIVLFSGSLYALALTGERWLGFVTPFGGVAMLAGWLALAIAALRPRQGQ